MFNGVKFKMIVTEYCCTYIDQNFKTERRTRWIMRNLILYAELKTIVLLFFKEFLFKLLKF